VDPLSTRQLNRAIHAAAEEAHINKRVSMHTLRHYVPFLTMSCNSAIACILWANE
jgi:site-specific recombinase XerD